MNQIITPAALIILMLTSASVYADTKDITCTNSSSYDLADQAAQEFKKILDNIDGVVKIEIETCAESESYGVAADSLECGVFVWFSNDDKREQFHQTTSLWGGKLTLSNGASVPVCSRASQQLMTSRGPY